MPVDETVDKVLFEPGLHLGVPMSQYQTIDALGSTRLGWMSVSPKQYKYMCEAPHIDTPATALGTALHMAALEPDLFHQSYALEPDPAIVCPTAKSPRATNAYKDAVIAMERDGKKVLRMEDMGKVAGMAQAIRSHGPARSLIQKATAFEVTAIWNRGDHQCRGRFDILGDGIIADIKTTRNLRDFSPWVLTRMGYYRQAGWYDDGAKRNGLEPKHFFFIAVENVPPFDVGVFVLDRETILVGTQEANRLLMRLEQCEREGEWPGMFPELEKADLTDAFTNERWEDTDGEG